jgi:hypothetical protein
MRTRCALGLGLLVAMAAMAPAAPAPFARSATTEAVLLAGTAKRGKAVKARLLSADFLAGVLRSERLRGLACLNRVADGKAWLTARLRVEPLRGGSRVRISLSNCTDKEGLLLLEAIVAGLTAKQADSAERTVLARMEQRRFQARLLLALRRQGAAVAAATNEDEVMTRYDIEANPPTVHQAPRRAGRVR